MTFLKNITEIIKTKGNFKILAAVFGFTFAKVLINCYTRSSDVPTKELLIKISLASRYEVILNPRELSATVDDG